MTLSRILCATDLSGLSRPALVQARALAAWEGADLHVVQVGDRLLARAAGGVRTVVSSVSIPADGLEHSRVTTVARRGSAVDVIVRYARFMAADLIVVGAALPRGGVPEWQSIGEAVARRTSVPTLVVPPVDEAAREDLPFRNVVCAIDTVTGSPAALERALAVAQRAGGRLTLVQVLSDVAEDGRLRYVEPEYRRLRETEARERVWSAVPREALDWAEIAVEVRTGIAADEIVAAADRVGADLIVLGVMHESAMPLLPQTITRAVTARAACPVLVVREAAAVTDPRQLGAAWLQSAGSSAQAVAGAAAQPVEGGV